MEYWYQTCILKFVFVARSYVHTPSSQARTNSSIKGSMYTPILFPGCPGRSEEHTSELQSQSNLVCRLLLEKKKKKKKTKDVIKKKQKKKMHRIQTNKLLHTNNKLQKRYRHKQYTLTKHNTNKIA